MATNPVASAAIAAKRRGEFCPPRPDVISLAPGAEPPIARLENSLAGDPSEVTALGIRH
jgi:hypothetical protein